MQKVLVSIFLFFAFACKQKHVSTPPADTLATDGTTIDSTLITDTSGNPVSVPSKTFRGFYSSRGDIQILRDCNGSRQTFQVEDQTEQLEQSYRRSVGSLSYPNESVYAEVRGYLKGSALVGPQSEFPNVLVVTELINFTQKNYNTSCFDYEYIASGTEPFWTLEIIPSERLIAFKDVAAEKSYVFPYSPATIASGTSTYNVTNEKKETLKIEITRENCSDGMSDRTYQYSAQVVINGKILSGCAIKKGDKV